MNARRQWRFQLYLIEILHQTTTGSNATLVEHELYLIEILHQTTTRFPSPPHNLQLYLIEILHQTTTLAPGIFNLFAVVSYRNSTSNHNPVAVNKFFHTVVSYRNSTSNHNRRRWKTCSAELYLIEILHQTTTSGLILIDKVLLTGCLPL